MCLCVYELFPTVNISIFALYCPMSWIHNILLGVIACTATTRCHLTLHGQRQLQVCDCCFELECSCIITDYYYRCCCCYFWLLYNRPRLLRVRPGSHGWCKEEFLEIADSSCMFKYCHRLHVFMTWCRFAQSQTAIKLHVTELCNLIIFVICNEINFHQTCNL